MKSHSTRERERSDTRRNWLILAWFLAPLVAIAVVWPTQIRRTQICRVCNSRRHSNETRWSQGLVNFSEESEPEVTAIVRDGLAASHDHEWESLHIAKRGLFIGSIAQGRMTHHRFAFHYAYDESFRRRVWDQVRAGSFSRFDLEDEVLGRPADADDPERRALAALVTEFESAPPRPIR